MGEEGGLMLANHSALMVLKIGLPPSAALIIPFIYMTVKVAGILRVSIIFSKVHVYIINVL